MNYEPSGVFKSATEEETTRAKNILHEANGIKD